MMTHNQFVEIMTVFGLLGGGVMLFLLLLTVARLWRRRRPTDVNDVYATLTWVFGFYLLGGFLENGRLYHPAPASILFICFFAAFTRVLPPVPTPIRSSVWGAAPAQRALAPDMSGVP